MSYGLDLGELIQQYIWLFWPVHTYNNAWFGQPCLCSPSLMHWSTTSLICGALVWLSVLGVYLSCFSSPRSIYYHLEHPTRLYLLTHTCLGVFNELAHLTNTHTSIRVCLCWVGSPLVHLGGIEVIFHIDTCTTQLASRSTQICPLYYKSFMIIIWHAINTFHMC